MSCVDGYAHHTGDHCGSTSLRNLSAHYDWGLDEPTCFGLAAGLGFTPFELDHAPHRGFFGRPLWIEDAFFTHLGIGFDRFEPGVATDAMVDADRWDAIVDRLRSQTAAGDPVLVYTDIYHLPYFGTDTHFAPHTVLVVDVEGDEVVLSDSEFDDLQRVPLTVLRAAMASDAVFELGYRHLVVTDPTPTVGLPAAMGRAIERTANAMLDPAPDDPRLASGTNGVDGIRAFAADVRTWTELADPQWTVRFAYQNVERRGTGGGAFRRLYARFLDRAATKLPALDASLAERTHRLADDWTAIGETFEAASELDSAGVSAFDDRLESASDALLAVSDREERLARDLLDAVSKGV